MPIIKKYVVTTTYQTYVDANSPAEAVEIVSEKGEPGYPVSIETREAY